MDKALSPIPAAVRAAALARKKDDRLTGTLPNGGLVEQFCAMHGDVLQAFGRHYGVLQEHLHMRDGASGAAIAGFAAESRVYALVMGSVQRNPPQQLSIGGVARDLLQRLDCDVLVRKPEGFEERLRTELEQGGRYPLHPFEEAM